VLIFSAILGDNIGYSFGRRTGHRIFKKKDGIIFRQEYLVRAEKFYEKHGGKTIILARFVPVVRTFAPIVAGAAKMSRERFIAFNIIGGILWCTIITMLGNLLGSKIPNIESYIIPVFVVVTIITFGPGIWHILKDAKTRAKLLESLKYQIRRILRRLGLNKKVDL
jgi:membrane-associated protein